MDRKKFETAVSSKNLVRNILFYETDKLKSYHSGYVLLPNSMHDSVTPGVLPIEDIQETEFGVLRKLFEFGLIQTNQNNQFEVTELGSWYVIAARIGIPFKSLCLLAEIYYGQFHLSKNDPKFAIGTVVECYNIFKLFDEQFSLILGKLKSKEIIHRVRKKSYRINGTQYEEFKTQYHDQLISLYLELRSLNKVQPSTEESEMVSVILK